jgi:hypothetical protein
MKNMQWSAAQLGPPAVGATHLGGNVNWVLKDEHKFIRCWEEGYGQQNYMDRSLTLGLPHSHLARKWVSSYLNPVFSSQICVLCVLHAISLGTPQGKWSREK